jgi:hypothetical protein
MLEVHSGGDHRVVDDRVTDDLTKCRATKNRGAPEVLPQLAHELACLDQGSSAEDENYAMSLNCQFSQIGRPAITAGPLVLRSLHDLSPSSKQRRLSLLNYAGHSVQTLV